MSTSPLRAYVPDQLPAEPFRSDCATIGQVLDWYLANNPVKSKSKKAQHERERLYGILKHSCGSSLCADLRPHNLLSFINEHQDGSAWTRKRWNSTLQRPFNFAARLGLIDRNPFRGLSFPEGKDGRDWTDTEYRSLLRLACPSMRRFIVFIRFSGMRPGEIQGLAWPNIKWQAGAIILADHKTADKTKTPRRIPINSVIGKLLALIRKQSPADSPRVFLNSHGNGWTAKAFNKNFGALRNRAGLPSDVKCHGGRHYFSTQAIINGVDVAELSELLGHTNLKTTQRYVHMAGKVDHLSDAMERAIHTRCADVKPDAAVLQQIAALQSQVAALMAALAAGQQDKSNMY